MKIKIDKTYAKISLYAIATVLIAVAGVLILMNLKTILTDTWNNIIFGISLFTQLIVGFVIAWLCDPIANFFHVKFNKLRAKRGKEPRKTRGLAVLVTITLLVAFIVGTFTMLTMSIVGFIDFDEINITGIVNSLIATYEEFYNFIFSSEGLGNVISGTQFEAEINNIINFILTGLSTGIAKVITTIMSNILLLVFGIIVAVYVLIDKEKLLNGFKSVTKNILPEKAYRMSSIVIEDFDRTFAGFIRGQIIDAIIVGACVTIILLALRIDFAVIIGVIATLCNAIPYLGPAVAIVLTGIIAIVAPYTTRAIIATLLIVLLQQVDAWIIAPKIVGDKVKLHPLIVISVVLAAGSLFGIFGMFMATPVTAFVIALMRRYYSHKYGETAVASESTEPEESKAVEVVSESAEENN